MSDDALSLVRDGAAYHPGAAADQLATLRAFAEALPRDQAGLRLHDLHALAATLGPAGTVTRLVACGFGRPAAPVRALLFDKTPDQNWALGWHQDRTIVVRQRRDVAGFGPWTTKQGLLHVAPPAAILAQMVTVRIHLDPVDGDNAPLLVAAGTHRLGRIAEQDIAAIIAASDVRACHAGAGDVWTYATLILHASDRARAPRRRRVLQVDYAADPLPGGLEWRGMDGASGSGGGT